MNKNYFRLTLFTALFLPVVLYLLSTEVLFPSGEYSFLKGFYIFASILTYFISVGMLASCTWQPQAVDFADVTETSKAPIKVKVYIILLFALILGTIAGKKSTFIYNTSVAYSNAYEQKTEEKPGAYDELWKVAKQKLDITDSAKSSFIEVVKLQMSARADGQALTWKWVQENTQINYGVFMEFYKDVSDFVTQKRAEYRQLEKEALTISKQHNLLIDTFPNNIYNVFIRRKHIIYKYGLLSDSTNHVFETGVENLK